MLSRRIQHSLLSYCRIRHHLWRRRQRHPQWWRRLLRQAVFVHASWPVEVARGAGRPWRSGPQWAGAWIGDRGALTNPVVLVQPLTRPEETVGDIGALFPPQVSYLLISAWPTPDLRPYGLALLGHPPLMVRFPGPRPASPAPKSKCERSRTRTGSRSPSGSSPRGTRCRSWAAKAGRPVGPTLPQLATRVWLAWLDGVPVAMAAAHRHAGVTLVEYVATLPSVRGRGAGAAVTWAATLADPAARGAHRQRRRLARVRTNWVTSPWSAGPPGSGRSRRSRRIWLCSSALLKSEYRKSNLDHRG